MAYLDNWTLRTTPQWWTAAVYRRVAGKGLLFQKWLPATRSKWNDFMGVQLSYPSSDGYLLVPYYYNDGWRRDTGEAPRFSGEAGKLERRNPLPPGRYWQDIFDKQAGDWNAWLAAHSSGQVGDTSGDVIIERAEHFTPDPLRDGSWLPAALQPDNAGKIAGRVWVLFRVVRPVDWPAVKLGFPTIADDSVQQSSDTVDNPPGPTPTEEIAEAVEKVTSPLLWGLGLVLAIKAVQLLKK